MWYNRRSVGVQMRTALLKQWREPVRGQTLAWCLLLLLALLVPVLAAAPASITPPVQPASGPGGAEYPCRTVLAQVYGDGGHAYWIFEPADPTPAHAPLIVFNHGWGAIEPLVYGAWIDHLVRRGNIVVYPVYQANLLTSPRDFTPNALAAVQEAIRRLQHEPGHVSPELTHVALLGHSMGGVVSANMAALAARVGLPQAGAVMCVEPGNTWGLPKFAAVKLEDLSRIPPDTLLLSVAGDRDRVVRDIDAKRIYRETTHIPAANKNYVLLVSDDHGQPPLCADHLAPVAFNKQYQLSNYDHDTNSATAGSAGQVSNNTAPVNPGPAKALAFYGLWKLFDGLCDAAFYGKNRDYALGNTPEQRFMGRWSDGTPVKELQVVTAP